MRKPNMSRFRASRVRGDYLAPDRVWTALQNSEIHPSPDKQEFVENLVQAINLGEPFWLGDMHGTEYRVLWRAENSRGFRRVTLDLNVCVSWLNPDLYRNATPEQKRDLRIDVALIFMPLTDSAVVDNKDRYYYSYTFRVPRAAPRWNRRPNRRSNRDPDL